MATTPPSRETARECSLPVRRPPGSPHRRLSPTTDETGCLAKRNSRRSTFRSRLNATGTQAADLAGGDHDLQAIAARAPLSILCLRSALARYGLIDDIPAEIEMALPRGTPAPTPRARPARASGVPGTRTPAARCPAPSAGPRPMSLTDVAALRDAFRALSRGDFETASQVLAPDVG